jgi:VanZ family protein
MPGSLFAALARFPLALRALGFLACLAGVVAASHLDGFAGPEEEVLGYLQNLAHAPLFGALALSFLVLLGPAAPLRPLVWPATLALVLAAGLLDEWHQTTVETRGSDLKDVVTDLLGAFTALVLAAWSARAPLRLAGGALRFAVLIALLLGWGLVVHHAPVVPLPFLPA